MKPAAGTLALALVFALVGCGSSEPSETPSAEEKNQMRESMKSAWLGSWEGELLAQSGASPTFTLQIEAQEPSTTPQCGTVELDENVGIGCATLYTMGVKGVLSTNDGRFQDTVVYGSVESDTASFNLPNDGYMRLFQGDNQGRYRFGPGEPEGVLSAHKK